MAYRLPQEMGVRIHVNGELLATVMATPFNLRELAIGYLYNTGIIKSTHELRSLYACDDETDIYIETEKPKVLNVRNLLITAACGSAPVTPTEEYPRIDSVFSIRLYEIKAGFVRMFQENRLYQEHGAVHTAAVMNESFFAIAEDVGRHNAHDKAIGRALEAGADLTGTAVLCTGRISSEMVSKAIIAQIPILASNSLPTTLAAETAETFGITLIGRGMREEPLVITNPHRILR